MTEKEIMIEKMYEKYETWAIPLKYAAREWGGSYSRASKMLSPKNGIPHKIILDKKIMPKWIFDGSRKVWPLANIADWVLNTQYA